MTFDVVARETGTHAGERDQPIQGPAVQQVPAEVARHPAGNRALAGSAGAVDRNDRNLIHPSSDTCNPRARAVVAKAGNDVATFCTSRTVTGDSARVPRIANAMATRWSPWQSTVPPRTRPP